MENKEKVYFTDYPFTELGDTPYEPAPIRECTIKGYDGDKYCIVNVEGQNLEVKQGYIYTNKADYKTGINLSRKELANYE